MRGTANKTSVAYKRDVTATIAGHTATGVAAGTPGSFTGGVPLDLADLQAQGSLGETTAWAVGEYVLLQDGSQAHWDGAAWASGAAPA